MRLTLPLLLALAACTDPDADKGTGADDTGELGPNPIVPEQYELLWDTDAASCDGEEAIVYFLFNGAIDEGGHFSGTENWYWFFAGNGWDGDCVDGLTVEGDEGELGWSESPCSGCDREFLVDWELTDSTCGFNYDTFFSDDKDADYDGQPYHGDIMLDTLSPSGNVNENMLVFAFTQEWDDEYTYTSRPDSRGDYYPDEGADYATGSATLTWVVSSGICVDID